MWRRLSPSLSAQGWHDCDREQNPPKWIDEAVPDQTSDRRAQPRTRGTAMSNTLTHRGFTGTAEVSLEDGCLFGCILHINDSISYEGSSVAELEQAFIAAVDDYLKHCEAIGKRPDKPYSGTFNVRVGPERHRKLIDVGARLGKGLNETVIHVFDSYMDENLRAQHTFNINIGPEDIRRLSATGGMAEQHARIVLGKTSHGITYASPTTH